MTLLLATGDLILVLGLVTLCIAVGRSLPDIVGATSLSPREQLLISLAIGVGGVGTSILCIGLVGLATPVGLATLLVALAVLSRKQVRRLPSLLRRSVHDMLTDWSALEIIVVAAIAVFMLGHAALPPTNFDSLFYHLAIPELYLQEGRIFLPPDNYHAAFIGVVHMLYLPLLAFGSSSAPAMFSSVLAIALIPLMHLAGERFFDRATGRMAAILIWAGPILILVAITPRVDVTLIFYLFLAHYLLLRALEDPDSEALIWMSSLLLGIGVGIKLSALLYVGALLPLLTLVVWRRRERLATKSAALLCFGALLLACASPWFLKNWLWFGDPIYPHLGGLKPEGWLLSIYGSSPPVDVQSIAPSLQIRKPFNLADFFFAPHRLTPEGEGILYFANPVLLILPLWLLKRGGSAKAWIALPALLYGAAVLSRLSSGLNLRYLIPATVPLTLVAVALLAATMRRRLQLPVSLLFLLPLLASLALVGASSLTVSYLSGQMGETQYLRLTSNGELREYLNKEIPSSSKVLMLFDSRGYGIRPSVIPDPSLRNWQEVVPATRDGCLEESAVTHVMVNQHLFDYLRRRGLAAASVRWDEFPSFSERCLDLVRDGGRYQLYRLMKD